MKKLCLVATVWALSTVAACGDRTHLTQSYGRASRDVARRQAQNPQPASAPAKGVKGLDSQEAAIVVHTYRSGLAPKGVAVENQPMLMIAPGGKGQQAGGYMPPPSVPQGN